MAGVILIIGEIIGVANAKMSLEVWDMTGYSLTLHIKVKKLLMDIVLIIG